MGFLKDIGRVLTYDESQKYHQYIKKHGIIQFLNLYKRYAESEKHDDVFYWGDELEYQIVYIDPKNQKPQITLDTNHIFENFQSDIVSIQYEYGRWMVEAIPKNPYCTLCNPTPILENLKARRDAITLLLPQNHILYSAPVYPLLGVGEYYIGTNNDRNRPRQNSRKDEEEKISLRNDITQDIDNLDLESTFDEELTKKKLKKNIYSNSLFIDDEIINQHPRFPNLTRNIRLRRGEKICIKVPLYKDENTNMTTITNNEPYPGYIYMDAMGFGMGNCSLQVTFSTKNLNQARYLTDQLAIFSPIFLALSAGSPIFKGKLADIDVRWKVIADSVDDRTYEERDENHSKYLPKSRYDSISYYISNDKRFKPEYNDLKFKVNEDIMGYTRQKSKEMGIELDEQLLNHLGFLFIRDPLVIFEDKIDVNDEESTSHFENIQSTNWNSVRFKPPPSHESNIGWRVELRTCEIQLTDEENAAFIIFALFITRYIQLFNPNFYIPISLVDENFKRAHLRGAAQNQKFWFRKNIPNDEKDEYVELTLQEFFQGKEGSFTGMFALFDKLSSLNCDSKQAKDETTKISLLKCEEMNKRMMMSLLDRATGKHPTLATWIRQFVQMHPAYNKDSVINDSIATDLINAMNEISQGKKTYSDFCMHK